MQCAEGFAQECFIIPVSSSLILIGLVLAVRRGVVGSVVDGGMIVVTLVDNVVTAAEVGVLVLVFSSVGVSPNTVVFITVS